MSETPEAFGVVVAHGDLAQGLVDAVQRIAGPEPGALEAVSNEGCSPEELARRLEEVVGDRTAVIFTDLQTGSCALVARLVHRESTRRAVVFGVNLAMLLDFVFHRELALDELVPRLMEKGRESIRAVVPDSEPHADPARSG